MKKPANVWRRFTNAPVLLFCAALCVSASSGCATHNHYQAARPVSATLEIEVQGQWRTVQRTVYEYRENSKPETEDDK